MSHKAPIEPGIVAFYQVVGEALVGKVELADPGPGNQVTIDFNKPTKVFYVGPPTGKVYHDWNVRYISQN